MPQMSCLDWLMLLIYFFIIFYLFMIMMYFLFSLKNEYVNFSLIDKKIFIMKWY